jgi:HSP90 family molecular chaperone
MTNHASSLVAQFGVGFVSFVVSATCILAAIGPSHIAG